ncbi:MAG: chemotaxis protein CheX [Agathobacter sp.]|nr:chemotaxis protein CheX [Agathobacter sp.]MBQ3030327.1 chemotaxis protein CheX [Agathobacter sp.]MBQ6812949.1 chemotaxis protein CheX [Agathobacter sp.]
MYNQFFGNYLYSNEYVTKEHLISAIIRQTKVSARIDTLSVYFGYMSASEVEHVKQLQNEEGKKFSELAISYGYLTQEQVLELLNTKAPDFLTLGQILIDDGVFSYEQFENILTDYRSQSELLDLEIDEENQNEIRQLIDSFSLVTEYAIPSFGKAYLELLFKNFVRYIGEDFTALPPSLCNEFATEHCVSQTINGNYVVNTYLNMSEETSIAFAERYSNESYDSYDEYVAAALEDFINLHNGLFIVNASNDFSNELSLGTLAPHDNNIITFEHPTYIFPVYYPFGIIHFIMEVVSL